MDIKVQISTLSSACCRLVPKTMPKVDAAEALKEDTEDGAVEQSQEHEEHKKKKHKREKVGFRDRKVIA